MADQGKGTLFFGQFLLERGAVSQEALDDALQFQQEANHRIGELAVEKEYLQPHQVEKIFAEQKLRDEPFGVIALKFNFLKRAQLDDLLFSQAVNSTHLGEALLVRGHLSPEQFVEHLKAYNNMTKERQRELDALLRELPNRDVFAAVVKSLDRTFTRFTGRHARVNLLHTAPPAFSAGIGFVLDVALHGGGRVSCLVRLADDVGTVIAERLAASRDPQQHGEPTTTMDFCREFFEIMARYLGQALEDAGMAVAECSVGLCDEQCFASVRPALEMTTPAGPMFVAVNVAL